MILPGTQELTAMRWAPYKESLDFVGVDFTGATFAMEVRPYRDKTGSALVTLGNTTSPAQGISVSVATTLGVTTSTVEIRINETTIEGLPFAPTEESDITLVYDLVITGGGYPKSRWLEGPFVVRGGATQV